MNTIILSALATVVTFITFIIPGVLTANTYTSLTARWSVGLWLGTAAAALWYAAVVSIGGC